LITINYDYASLRGSLLARDSVLPVVIAVCH
jgi:hypothetical protein